MPQAAAVAEEVVVADDAAAVAAAAAAKIEEDEDAEFSAGFEGKPTEVTPPADIDKPVVEDPPAEVVPEVKYRQITETEYAALVAQSTAIEQIKADNRKELDKAFGKVGGLERTLATLQAATPQGYAVDVTDDIVADLVAEYPEMGALALKAFKKFAGTLKGTAPAAAAVPLDPKEIDARVEAKVLAREVEALEDDHADWREVTGAKDSKTPYREWLATQPAEYQTKLGSTNSAAVVSKSITKFKEFAAAAAAEQAKKDAAAKKIADAAATRKQRLDQAATERGAGGHEPATSDDDQFQAGFKSG